MIERESWCKECMTVTSSKEDILHFLAGPAPFESLPPHFQESIREYTLEGIPDEEEFRQHMAKYGFLIGEVPTEVLIREIERVQGGRGEIDPDFEKYHQWYIDERAGPMPDHGPKNRWPVTLSQYYEEEVLEDGWHRLHDYYRKGHKTIPVMEWVKRV